MLVSGVRDPPFFVQDYHFTSIVFSYYGFQIVQKTRELTPGDMLIETNPQQLLRRAAIVKYKMRSIYVNYVKPTRPPFTNIFLIKSAPPMRKAKLGGKHKCYLCRDDECYVRDGHAIIYVTEPFIAYEAKEFVKRFGNKALLYTADSPLEFMEEECETVVPTNPYADAILQALQLKKPYGDDIPQLVYVLKRQLELFA